MLERQLEQYFSKLCKDYGLLTLKLNVRFSRGWPDRVVVSKKGKVIWVELKTLTGKLTKLQEHVHEQLRSHKQVVYVLRTKEEILTLLSQL